MNPQSHPKGSPRRQNGAKTVPFRPHAPEALHRPQHPFGTMNISQQQAPARHPHQRPSSLTMLGTSYHHGDLASQNAKAASNYAASSSNSAAYHPPSTQPSLSPASMLPRRTFASKALRNRLSESKATASARAHSFDSGIADNDCNVSQHQSSGLEASLLQSLLSNVETPSFRSHLQQHASRDEHHQKTAPSFMKPAHRLSSGKRLPSGWSPAAAAFASENLEQQQLEETKSPRVNFPNLFSAPPIERRRKLLREASIDSDAPLASIEPSKFPTARLGNKRNIDGMARSDGDESWREDSVTSHFGNVTPSLPKRRRQKELNPEVFDKYFIPEELEGVCKALGPADWVEYVGLIEKLISGELDEDEVLRREKRIFGVYDERMRRTIRKLTIEMINPPKEA